MADGAQPIILYSVAADVEGGERRVGLQKGGQVSCPITREAVTGKREKLACISNMITKEQKR